MKRTIEATRTKEYNRQGVAHKMTATFGLSHLGNNKDAHWHLVCDIKRKGANGRWCDGGGGAAHEEILRVFPHLRPFAQMHLNDESGLPMYAVANGEYRLRQAAGFNYDWAEETNADYRANGAPHAASHFFATPEEIAEVFATLPTWETWKAPPFNRTQPEPVPIPRDVLAAFAPSNEITRNLKDYAEQLAKQAYDRLNAEILSIWERQKGWIESGQRATALAPLFRAAAVKLLEKQLPKFQALKTECYAILEKEGCIFEREPETRIFEAFAEEIAIK